MIAVDGYFGDEGDIVLSVAVTIPPTVRITSPRDDDEFVSPAMIVLSAEASDRDGSVTQVEFYANGTLVGAATASPFRFTWRNVPADFYELIAVATDNHGVQATSNPIFIFVNER